MSWPTVCGRARIQREQHRVLSIVQEALSLTGSWAALASTVRSGGGNLACGCRSRVARSKRIDITRHSRSKSNLHWLTTYVTCVYFSKAGELRLAQTFKVLLGQRPTRPQQRPQGLSRPRLRLIDILEPLEPLSCSAPSAPRMSRTLVMPWPCHAMPSIQRRLFCKGSGMQLVCLASPWGIASLHVSL